MVLSYVLLLSVVIYFDEVKECWWWRYKIYIYFYGGRGIYCLVNDDVDGVDDFG